MRVRVKRSRSAEIPTSSFSDVAFLLIIFFILTTTFDKITGLLTELPAGQKSQTTAEKVPTVQLHEHKIMYDERQVDLSTLRKELDGRKLREQHGEKKVVLLESSGEVPYQLYFEVMTAITKAGGVIAIVSEEESKKK